MAGSDVKAVRVTGTGAALAGPARIRGIVVTTSGAARVTITDGDGGSTVLDLDAVTTATVDTCIPGEGIKVSSGIYVSAATNVTGATIYYS